jgi:RNA recognition motif. (a.k.a. RRM, RBD, or RNP domain)
MVGSACARVRLRRLFSAFWISCSRLSLFCERVFGLTDLTALREGKVGRQCRGEEHVVELVRNKSSGKIRVYWNQSNITHLFRQRYIHEDSILGQQNIEYVWKTRSGETLRIVYIPRVTVEDSIKFDFFVDGVNFTNLPTVGQLGRLRVLERSTEHRFPYDDAGSQRSFDSSIATNEGDDDEQSSSEMTKEFRVFGYNSLTSSKEDEIINDELHSHLYSNALSSLRNQIVTFLPQTEEMVSRSIISAFFVDSSPAAYPDSLDERNAHQVEADLILEAHRWARLNIDFAPRRDVEDLSLHFFQKCMDRIFLLIRNDELSTSDEAARTLFSVGAVLGLEFAYPMARDTMILDDLAPETTDDDVREALSPFGEIDAVSVSSVASTFGFCRFFFEDHLCQCVAGIEDGSVLINGRRPKVSILYSGSLDAFQLNKDVECLKDQKSEAVGGEGISLTTSVPPPPHLMGPLCYSPDSVAQKRTSYDFVERSYERAIHHPHYSTTSTCY